MAERPAAPVGDEEAEAKEVPPPGEVLGLFLWDVPASPWVPPVWRPGEDAAAVARAVAAERARLSAPGGGGVMAFRMPDLPVDLRPTAEDLAAGPRMLPARKPGCETLHMMAVAHGALDGADFCMFRATFRALAGADAAPGAASSSLEVQLLDGVIYARRRLEYTHADRLSAGMMFERACIVSDRPESSLRTVALASVGGFRVVLSAETDAIDGGRPLELKTAARNSWRSYKRRSAWIQCHFCGTERLVLGERDGDSVGAVRDEPVGGLVADSFKRRVAAGAARALRWLRDNVTREGVVYGVEVTRGARQLRLSEIVGGYARSALLTPEAAAAAADGARTYREAFISASASAQ